jgi:endogenous inhibitor of DNA gyrase (YacG/DUF329 family)
LTIGSEEALGERPEQRSCRACGFRFINSAHGDCCTARCAQYLAEGNPSKAEQERLDNPFSDRRQFGPVGIYTTCRGCGGRFESRGLQLCPDCYPALGDRDDIKKYGAVSKAARAVLAKPCPECGGEVAAYTAEGKKNTATYCSNRCKGAAYRRRRDGETTNDTGALVSRHARLNKTNDLEGAKTDRLPLKMTLLCEVCRKPISRVRRGRQKTVCSDACQKRRSRMNRQSAAA